MRRLTSRPRRDERGAVIVLMTAFVVVIVGVAALVVDVGALLDERRQLQNGADAGALAVAQSCALGSCNAGLAAPLADANSRDARSDASVSYPAARKVHVDTSTIDGGESILPYSFAQILSGVEGKKVEASAEAIWGSSGRATVIRLAISECDFERLGLGPVESTIVFHTTSSQCDNTSGGDNPGAFGWLKDDGIGDTCELSLSAPGRTKVDPGASGPTYCLAPYIGKDISLPVYDHVLGLTGPGGTGEYLIKGFARFHLTGYRFANGASPSPPCSGSNSCIRGYFVRYLTATGVIGGADFGVTAVKLVS